MIELRFLPLRARLTFWYMLVLGAVVALYVAGTSFVLYWQLSRQLSRFAVQDVETVEGLLYFTPDGHVNLNENYHNHPQSRLGVPHPIASRKCFSIDGVLMCRSAA